MILLQLIDVSPAVNPDTLTFYAKFSGTYGVQGTGDPLNMAPYAAGSNPGGFTNPNNIPVPELPLSLTQAPAVEAENIGGYYVQPSPLIPGNPVEGVAQGIALNGGYFLRMYAPGGAELGTGVGYTATAAAITAAGAGVQIAITFPHNQ